MLIAAPGLATSLLAYFKHLGVEEDSQACCTKMKTHLCWYELLHPALTVTDIPRLRSNQPAANFTHDRRTLSATFPDSDPAANVTHDRTSSATTDKQQTSAVTSMPDSGSLLVVHKSRIVLCVIFILHVHVCNRHTATHTCV